jgi:ferredoxin-thioredoxin reductase catalytic subunit
MNYINLIVENFTTYLSNNDFASAGFVLGFIGVCVTYLRGIPALIKKWSFRSIEVRDDIEYFECLKKFLSNQQIYFSRHSIYYGKKNTMRLRFASDQEEPKEVNSIVDEHGIIFHRNKIILFSVNRNTEHKNDKSFNESITLRFLFTSKKEVNEIVDDIIVQNAEKKDVISIFSSSSSYWDFHSHREKIICPPILPNNQLRELENDFCEFFRSEELYRKRNIPYHRGYLLYGIPGSGKSSLVQYLAYKYSCNIHLIRSKESLTGENFPELIEKLPKDSILLVEDMDRIFEDKKNNIDVSNLLNCIDGVLSPTHRYLLFITANNKSLIPDALIRPGRIDYQLEFKHATREQIEELCVMFFPKANRKKIYKYCKKLASKKVSMTFVREQLLRVKDVKELYE